MKTWVSGFSIGARRVAPEEFESLWAAADWETRFINDSVRAQKEWEALY